MDENDYQKVIVTGASLGCCVDGIDCEEIIGTVFGWAVTSTDVLKQSRPRE